VIKRTGRQGRKGQLQVGTPTLIETLIWMTETSLQVLSSDA
jgi:hypothetical protein